jgi:hypothetical protein
MLPVGGRTIPDGETMVRVGFQSVAGHEAYHGSHRIHPAPVQADVDWTRQIVSFEAFHQFSRTVGAGAAFPYFRQEVENGTTGVTSRASGWGDLSFYALWTPWGGAEEPDVGALLAPAHLSLHGGLSLPTGDPLQGEIPGLHNYHLGSGSVEFKLGLRYWADATDYLRLFAATIVVIDGGPDPSGFVYGNSYEWDLGLSISPLRDLWAYAEGIAIVRSKDRQGVLTLDDTGGTWWFVEAGMGARVVGKLSLEGSVSLPVYRNVNGVQPVPGPVYSLGFRLRF